MNNRLIPVIVLSGLLLWMCSWIGCESPSSEPVSSPPQEAGPLFQLLDAEETGIDFFNAVEDQESFNILTYRNFYNGGGVAVGDVNNDQLPDVYFTSNLSENKLYLNRGNWTFEDVTEAAGVAGTKGWSTGAAMADVNGDGWLDIYVSNSGDLDGTDKENELFINQGDGTFQEQAEAYGLNNEGYSTQAVFFDYDLDGDLDCYLLNNSFKDPSKIELYKSMRDKASKLGGDKLYRNDGNSFTNVTTQAGIYSSEIGFGLGAAIGDVNQDLLPDIYISNDFWERDYLYINKGDGTFSEELIDRISMCSIASMGGDIADINNDGNPEIFSTDMLAGDNFRLQAMTSFDPYHLEDLKYRANYHYQVLQNCLHLNDGQGRFQEVALLSGVAATDWSWGALIFDFENDGRKDIFVSNGIHKDIMSLDFRDFMADSIAQIKTQNGKLNFLAFTDKMPSIPKKNYAFLNKGGLQFENQADKLGFGQPTFSNGAAYADMDNDGDLDLLVNNVNMPAFVYQNKSERLNNHYLKVKFEGYAQNPFGIGARVKIRIGEEVQLLENYSSRGFESSIEPTVIFGTGTAEKIDELEVIWPDKQSQKLRDVPVDQILTLSYTEATAAASSEFASTPGQFEEISKKILPSSAKHVENRYSDFDHEILLLNMLSTDGPRLVKGDVNNDQREDFLLLGAADDEDKLFIQTADGKFRRRTSSAFTISKGFESTCGAFFDHDQDGDLDLMIGSGGNEYGKGAKFFILRYYRNDGKGNYVVDNTDIPQIVGNFSSLEPSDIDGDGDMDLFLGGRAVPGNYGLPPRSYLLLNDRGTWRDVSPEHLAGVGMVTDASWVDLDQDQDEDLVVVGDWMAIHIFKNNQGRLSQPTVIPNSAGWWTRVESADLDQDGDQDLVLGNWGLNTKLKASPSKPLSMYVNDFDGNEKSEFIINWYPPLEERAYPFAPKAELTRQLPGLRKAILKYEDYASKTYETLFQTIDRESAIPYQATWMESAVLWNENSTFNLAPLPAEAQVAPVFGIVVEDFNGDGVPDIYLGGNFYGLKPQVGRHDSNRGVFLITEQNRKFGTMSSQESGIYLEGEVRDACLIKVGKENIVLVSRNNLPVIAFKKRQN